ncbi:hypothetical protein EVA_02640 [gut metagenome]|uniref:Uncharacterized protein n=1 Tax=gut metagenome TaxID=749906 RepID=J9GNN1_9ZZZZ
MTRRQQTGKSVSMTSLPPVTVTIYVEWWTVRHLMTLSELTSKWLSRVRTLTRTQEKRWSDSSVGCSMKRQRNRFLRADPKQKSRETPALCRSAVPTVGQRQVCNYFWWLSQNVRQRPSH